MDISSRLMQLSAQAIDIRAGRARVKWPTAIRAEILSLFDAGESIDNLSEATKIPSATIVYWLDARRPKERFKEIKLKPETPSTRHPVRVKGRGIEVFVELAPDDLVNLIQRVFL